MVHSYCLWAHGRLLWPESVSTVGNEYNNGSSSSQLDCSCLSTATLVLVPPRAGSARHQLWRANSSSVHVFYYTQNHNVLLLKTTEQVHNIEIPHNEYAHFIVVALGRPTQWPANTGLNTCYGDFEAH